MNDQTEPEVAVARQAINMISAQDLIRWSDDHDRIVIAALREYIATRDLPPCPCPESCVVMQHCIGDCER